MGRGVEALPEANPEAPLPPPLPGPAGAESNSGGLPLLGSAGEEEMVRPLPSSTAPFTHSDGPSERANVPATPAAVSNSEKPLFRSSAQGDPADSKPLGDGRPAIESPAVSENKPVIYPAPHHATTHSSANLESRIPVADREPLSGTGQPLVLSPPSKEVQSAHATRELIPSTSVALRAPLDSTAPGEVSGATVENVKAASAAVPEATRPRSGPAPPPVEPAISVARQDALAQSPPQSSIHVRIGRVEVKAVTPPEPQQPQTRTKTGRTLSLDDYLRQRNTGRYE